MGPTKIMIIRHAEKPATYGDVKYDGMNAEGKSDKDSLITMGWERAGAIANLFYPTNAVFQNPALATPAYIYAADPVSKSGSECSQRPYQTVSALYGKTGMSQKHLNTSFNSKDYAKMVASVLSLSGTVLISWQHQDILPHVPGDDSIVTELLKQTSTPAGLPIPSGHWPGSRFDMVFVFDRPSGKDAFTGFTQVPQLLLAGDLDTIFPL